MANKKFVFRSNQTVGAVQAELDSSYLSQCFVDTGDLSVLRDCRDARRIIVGRTGAGKSALILQLAKDEERVISIEPEALALTYIANSNILNFFFEAGVKMDIFYRLLWRHVFCVEILKSRFKVDTEERKKTFIDTLWSLIPRNKNHELALDYLRKWGDSFWLETEYRIKEITTNLERELEGTIGGIMGEFPTLGLSAARKLTEEQKEEVVNRAQEVVNRVQIRELSTVIQLLGDILLSDPQQRYFVTIDKLDEDWVEDTLRFRLIRALIETSLDFARIENVKIVVVLRRDLLDRVYRYTRDPGFQEEKYRSSSLDIIWSERQLIDLLDFRIGILVRSQYTKQKVSSKDLLPAKVGNQQAINYILDRTLMRPRDIIQFFNECIKYADGSPTISLQTLREAEGVYSRERLRALADEWYGLYPNLFHLVNILKSRKDSFLVGELPLTDFEDNLLELLISGTGEQGLDLAYMNMCFEEGIDLETYRKNIILIFYKVGLVGLKLEKHYPTSWSYLGGVSVSRAEVSNDTRVLIHKAFWRALGIPGKK